MSKVKPANLPSSTAVQTLLLAPPGPCLPPPLREVAWPHLAPSCCPWSPCPVVSQPGPGNPCCKHRHWEPQRLLSASALQPESQGWKWRPQVLSIAFGKSGPASVKGEADLVFPALLFSASQMLTTALPPDKSRPFARGPAGSQGNCGWDRVQSLSGSSLPSPIQGGELSHQTEGGVHICSKSPPPSPFPLLPLIPQSLPQRVWDAGQPSPSNFHAASWGMNPNSRQLPGGHLCSFNSAKAFCEHDC